MLTVLPRGLIIRKACSADHTRIIAVLKAWWGGRDLTALLPRLFLDHFGNTSFIIEKALEGAEERPLVAFLIGFLSPARTDEGYIHFVGVAPGHRGCGIGAHLYARFFDLCRENGRHIVRSCTSPVNHTSVAFHRKMGFDISKGDAHIDGWEVTNDYNRPGDPKVCFERKL
jgi:GNAT superfamily N-acetyltransferase